MYPWGHCEHVTKSHSMRSGLAPAARRSRTAAAARRLSTAGTAEVPATAVSVMAAVAAAEDREVGERRKPGRIFW